MSDKPELQPPSQPRPFASDPDASRFKLIALIGFVILAIGAFVVIVILPDQVAKRRDNVQVTTEAPPVRSEVRVAEEPKSKIGETPEETAAQKKIEAQGKTEARELLQKVLKRQARLESEGVKIWGAKQLVTSYRQALASLAKANAYLDDQFFDQAAKGYRETIVKLNQLDDSRPERVRRAIQAGDEALAQLDGKLARRHYEIALAADSGNSKARVGLQRAGNLPQVLERIAQAQIHEANGNPDRARQMYKDAIALDKNFQSARDHLRRVDALILERDFRRAMSDAISALNQKEIGQAKHALDVTRKLRPDAAGVRDLEQRLKNTELLVELQRLGKQALQYEQEEQWEKAVNTYIMVLKIDANAGFAQQGKLRAGRFLELNRQVQHYLSNPDDLQASEHRDHARKIYERAVAKSDTGPKFREKTEKLHELLEAYSKPVSIVLQSDDMTDVRIYRVGRFGHFLEHRLLLRPGRYKALGTRSGYRDVSVLFTVPVSGEEMTFVVYCKEKI